jgi:hypothetical protein
MYGERIMGDEPLKIGMETVVVRDRDVIYSEMDGEAVMVSMERGEYYGMNVTGTRIWNELENPVKVADLCAGLKTRYNVSQDKCESDVLKFLNLMAEKGVVRVLEG